MREAEIIYSVPVGKLQPNKFGPVINPPMMPDDRLALEKAIQRSGIRMPLVVWKRKGQMTIICGNNRWRIAKKLGIKDVDVIFREFSDMTDAKLFAGIDNAARRQMNVAQKAELALEIQKLLTVGKGRRTDLLPSSDMTKVDARSEAAKLAGVSTGMMSNMRLVLDHADKKLLKKVRMGKVKASAAANLVREVRRGVPSRRPAVLTDEPVLTCYEASADELTAHMARLYLKPGMRIADVTHGDGLMWRRIDLKQYDFHGTDIATGKKRMDFRKLKYKSKTFDVAVLDPPFHPNWKDHPYVAGFRYRNHQHEHTTYKGILALYRDGMKECLRILKPGGMMWVKCADAVYARKQLLLHIDIHNFAVGEMGMSVLDMFILKRRHGPARNSLLQRFARKNHSFFWVFQKPA